MGDFDFSRTPSTTDDNEFYESTERILKSCLEMESLGSTTHRLTISERCVVFVVKKHLEENPGFFDSSCEELRFSATDFHSRLNEVWEGIFSDEKINWGRILTMLCFCRSASVYSQRVGLPPSAVESIAPWATTFICSTLKDWIVSEGGWVRDLCKSVLIHCVYTSHTLFDNRSLNCLLVQTV